MNIQASNTVYVGLFGCVVSGTLRNLGVWLAPDGIVVSSSEDHLLYAGGLVGGIYSSDYTTIVIRNCYVEAEGNGAIRITGNRYLRAGGIAGISSVGLITHCYATVDVEAKSNERVTLIPFFRNKSRMADTTLFHQEGVSSFSACSARYSSIAMATFPP